VRHRARLVGQRGGRGLGQRGGLRPLGGAEHERHLDEPAGPARACGRRQLALDDARDDRLLALGLDLIGHDELALARLQQIDRVGLDRLGIEEPAGQLGSSSSAADCSSRGSASPGQRQRLGGVAKSRSQRSKAAGGDVPRCAVQRQRLADARAARGGSTSSHGQLLRRAQRGQLRFQALLADLAAGGVQDTDLVC
jgi:hypothetical protein